MTPPTNLRQAQTALRQAQKAFKEIKLKASQLRDQHLEDRLGAAQIKGEVQKVKAIATIKCLEVLQMMYRKIRHITKKKSERHFSHLIVTRQGQDEVITNTTDMFHHIIQRNTRHFSQAQGTPFSVPPLNKCTTLEAIEQYKQDHTISEACHVILQYIQNLPSLPTIDTHISQEDLMSLYKVWNENTSTSPSGIHLGHDKCPLQYETETDQPSLAQRLYGIKTRMINLALSLGLFFSLEIRDKTIKKGFKKQKQKKD